MGEQNCQTDAKLTNDYTPNAWTERVKRIDILRAKVQKLIAKASEKQRKTYNKNRKNEIHFELGNLVFYPNNKLSKAIEGYSSKLAPRYKGPAIITEKLSPMVVIISDAHDKKIGKYHVNDLKLAKKGLRSQNKL